MSENADVVSLPSAKEETEVEVVPVFELDDETYYMPLKPSAGLSLKYLKYRAKRGSDEAMYFIMEEMLGEDVYDLLMEHPAITQEHITQIFSIVENQVLGDGSGKKPSSGAKKVKNSKK